MGSIYSKVFCVYVWLGPSPRLRAGHDSLFTVLTQRRTQNTLKHWRIVRQERLSVVNHVFFNDYWCRGWIIQELVLAREVVVMLGAEQLEFSRLVGAAKHFQYKAYNQSPFS
jgi:hypothetical protein